MTDAFVWLFIVLVVLAVVIVLLGRFYERATREISLVKTGVGGRKVVMDGGVIAIPYFHEVSRVNMQTLRLEVSRRGEAALITQDRLRVDVGVEFYVSVIASEEGIARAAQTLGNRTFHTEKLRELIEGKLVDALHAAAARVTMDELHENRGAFVAEVRESLAESLARNGLELDTVSLTALDQTPFKALDENNAFNAVGMRKLAEVIAKSKKERAEIDGDAEVSVRRAAMQVQKRKLEIELEQQAAEIAQVQQIETLKAAQLAEVVKRKADSELESAHARIDMEREIRAADIARERDIELANQERQIILAGKSQEQGRARVAADAVKVEVVRAAEAIETARQIAEAERRKAIALIAAAQDAETSGTRSAAQKNARVAEAEGRRALIDAENKMDERIVAMKIELAKLDTLPKVVAEMVKPAEKIDSIKIYQISGLSQGATGQSGAGGAPAINQIVDSIMGMAVQLPALKKIGEELGMSLDAGMTGRGGSTDAEPPGEKPGKSKNA